jgi:hypothetical protein
MIESNEKRDFHTIYAGLKVTPKTLRGWLVARIWPGQAPRMQNTSDWLPELVLQPGPADAKRVGEPGSRDTLKSAVSRGPGCGRAPRALTGTRINVSACIFVLHPGNQTMSLAGHNELQQATKHAAVAHT